jgi:hypothetical protein
MTTADNTMTHQACGTTCTWQHDGVCMRSSHDWDPFCDCCERLRGLWWCNTCGHWFDPANPLVRA